MKMSKKSKIVIYILLGLVAIYFLAPFIYMLFSAFKTEGEAIAYPPKLLPSEWHFENFINLLSTMMIPWDVTMIPQYMEFNLFGWINTLKPLIVPAWFGSAYYVFLMRQFLMGIPKDFEEAARIDGANQFQIYWKIFMPIMKPSLILVGVLNMLTVWNDYLGPLIFLQDRSKYTLALGLASFKGVHSTQIIPMLCITIIMIIPPIIIFIIAQKYIVEGLTAGSVKG